MQLLLASLLLIAVAVEGSMASQVWPMEETIDLTGHIPESNGNDLQVAEIQVPAQIIAKRSRARLCGQQLINAIRLTCMERARGKRSIQSGEWAMDMEDDGFDRPGYGRFQAMSFLKGTQMHKRVRGASDACCAKPCTKTTLATYC